MIIFALDPGGTTGWARCKIVELADTISEDGVLRTKRHGEYKSGQLEGGAHHKILWDKLAELLQETDELHIVVESFQFRQFDNKRDGIVLVSLEYIGVARLFHMMHPDRTKLVMQTPAEGKTFVTNDKIRAIGLWSPALPHAMDAMRHLLYYQVIRLKDYSFIDKWR